LVGEFGAEIVEPRRDSIAAFMKSHGIVADVVYALTASSTHQRASAWFTSDDAARGGVAFTVDGNPFTHRFFNTVPGTVALPISSTSMTGLHEFGHAASSFTDGKVVDQYVDSSPDLNVKSGRPIPAAFGTLNATNYNSDLVRDGLGYPAGWTSYHPALTA